MCLLLLLWSLIIVLCDHTISMIYPAIHPWKKATLPHSECLRSLLTRSWNNSFSVGSYFLGSWPHCHHHLTISGQLQLLFCFRELALTGLWGLESVGLVSVPASAAPNRSPDLLRCFPDVWGGWEVCCRAGWWVTCLFIMDLSTRGQAWASRHRGEPG